jgi:hypothetical protein
MRFSLQNDSFDYYTRIARSGKRKPTKAQARGPAATSPMAKSSSFPPCGGAPIVLEEMEEQAAAYWGTLAIGGSILLSEAQMADNFRQFGHHGQKK